jgi:hypothetical protein
MTQSKKPDFESTVNIEELDLSGLMEDDTITINLDDTYGATTSYSLTDSISNITIDTSTYDSSFTVNTTDTIDIGWIYNNMNIDPNEVERMCKEYPALEKVWRNFKSVYDMVKQDYEGKKKAGDIEDEYPF